MAKSYSIIFAVIVGIVIAVIMFLIFKKQSVKIAAAIIALLTTPFLMYKYFMRKYSRRKKILSEPFPQDWENTLAAKVAYYSTLDEEKRARFKMEVQIFLGEKLITGIETEINDEIRLLTAASAIIPVFGFPDWEYDELSEVLIYPKDFDENYDFDSNGGNILGMVGIGGCMVLSKPSLLHGFKNDKDKMNVGIHEFVHKIDEKDGFIDGIPDAMADAKIIDKWRVIMKEEMQKMRDGESEINPYGLTNEAEFFAVTSEYFFEHPEILEKKHPDLYDVLKTIYRQDTKNMFKSVVKSMFRSGGKKIGRNSPCPCGSGEKYKKCCLNKKKNSF